MTTFEDAKVGDKVWDMRIGWTTIISINDVSRYPIRTEAGKTYTTLGTCTIEDKFPVLFWDEVSITPPEKPIPKLEVDTKVLVRDSLEAEHIKRYFSHFEENGSISVFANGTTSWTYNITVPYSYWELAKDEQCQDS